MLDFSVDTNDLYLNANNIANRDSGNGRHLLQDTVSVKECIPGDQTYEQATAWCKDLNINNIEVVDQSVGPWQVCSVEEVQSYCCDLDDSECEFRDAAVWATDACVQ